MRTTWILAASTVTLLACGDSNSANTLLHVSYDPTRELFEDINARFATQWLADHPDQAVEVRMSHGGSGRQARAVIDGLEADVVTLAIPFDVDAIATEGGGLEPGWRERLPHHSSPWSSTIVFVVRRGNPDHIADWTDLVEGDVEVITANPKTSGAARLAYLAAYGHAVRHGWNGHTGDEAGTEMVRALYARVPVLDSGARGSSNTFARNHLGDVLLTWENEAHLLLEEMPAEGLEIVVPPESILAEPPAALIDRNVDRHGTRALADAYLAHLFTRESQDLAAQHFFRPADEDALRRHAGAFPTVVRVSPETQFGDWDTIQRTHFADGALFDRIVQRQAAE